MTLRIGCIGEVMIELRAGTGDACALGVAGDTYNAAVYLARLLRGRDATVSYVTALGDDGFSERILAHMEAHGLKASHVERRAGMAPGLYAIETDETGERSFTYWRSASAARTLFREPCAVPLDRLRDFDLVLLSGITLAILPPETRAALMAALDRFRAAGGRVAFDSNHRPALWDADTARAATAAMWARADVALPSVDDEMALFGDRSEAEVLARLRKLGCRDGALKRGLAGPVPIHGEPPAQAYPPAERVVDTTAAGDSFDAGFLAAHALGMDAAAAMRAGHAVARQVVGAPGAIVAVETPEDLRA